MGSSFLMRSTFVQSIYIWFFRLIRSSLRSRLVLYLYSTCIILLSPFHFSLFTIHYLYLVLFTLHGLIPAWSPRIACINLACLFFINLSIFIQGPLHSNKRFLVISTGTSSHFWSSTRVPNARPRNNRLPRSQQRSHAR